MDVVTVDTGRLEGSTSADGRVRSYLGVPYAAPPIGDLRWREPQPAAAWTGVRPAKHHAPSARQPVPRPTSLYYGREKDFSEDCLHLNVWTGPAPEAGRPVLVWLHFGAYQFGSASNPQYDGAALARRGATVVTVNHRLGRFGFLAHPLLSAESAHGVSGNYGLLDQIAALQWVQRNIASFGGDPDNVTLFGVSAGGNSVHNLRASGLARGLFHRVIAQSGPGVARVLDGPGHPAGPQTLSAGEAAGQEVTDLLGVSSTRALRALPAEAIESAMLPRLAGPWQFDILPTDGTSMHVFDSAYPVVDGHVLAESPLTAYESGRALDVPMLVGNAGNEGSGLPYLASLRDYRQYLEQEYGDIADELFALYPAGDDAEAVEASRTLEGDRIFVWSSWTAARLQRRSSTQPVRYYRFLRQPPIPATSDIIERPYARAFHGAELPYIFGTFDAWDWPWTPEDHELGEEIATAWLSFARTGVPSTPRAGEWPEFDELAPTTMVWDTPSSVGDAVSRDRMELFDRVNGLRVTARQS